VRRGLQFPWESAPMTGEEAAPLPGSASWHEHHVSLDIAEAFAFFANVTGDERFRTDKAWPILSGVSDWLVSRVVETERGYEIAAAMGVAERKVPADNSAFTNMAAKSVLHHAIVTAERLGRAIDPAWQRIADRLVLPRRGDIILSHDGYRATEEKGATPDPLMGIFPLGIELGETVERATLEYYLGKAEDYVGAPMLSALYGVWAARLGDRGRALRMLEEGYGKFVTGRFHQTLEYRRDTFPEQPPAGPFFANIGGFLAGLILGFSGLRPSSADPSQWASRPVVLPGGWQAIEIERLWVRGREARLEAVHGADRAVLTVCEGR
jgi:trehalose/maltose hydrolase-like predicted phosphorylase